MKKILLFVILAFSLASIRGYALNSSYNKYAAIPVQCGETLYNYSILIRVPYDSDMLANFTDLWFENATDSSRLDFYVENVSASDFANIWIEIPVCIAGSNTTINMHYSNKSAVSSSSNCPNTFYFCDDFEDNDVSDWSQRGAGTYTKNTNSTANAYGGRYAMNLTTTSWTTSNIAHGVPLSGNTSKFIWTFAFKHVTDTGRELDASVVDATLGYAVFNSKLDGGVFYASNPTWNNTGLQPADNAWNIFDIYIDNTTHFSNVTIRGLGAAGSYNYQNDVTHSFLRLDLGTEVSGSKYYDQIYLRAANHSIINYTIGAEEIYTAPPADWSVFNYPITVCFKTRPLCFNLATKEMNIYGGGASGGAGASGWWV